MLMSSNDRSLAFWLLLVVQDLLYECKAQKNKEIWHGGDWALESLGAKNEPIGVKGEWADYAYTLSEGYDEEPDKRRPTPEQEQSSPDNQPNLDKLDWYPLGPKEIPYLSVIYRRDFGSSSYYRKLFAKEPDPGPSHIEPGTACGGALLTPMRVLTVCGCFMSVISDIQGAPNLFPPGYRYPHSYDIYEHQAHFRLPKIYVTHSEVRFQPDFKHEIETDRYKWSNYGTLTCKEFLQNMDRLHKGDDEGKKAAKVNSELIVIPFKPAVKPDFPGFFTQWPPTPINDLTDLLYTERVNLISIGMRQLRQGRYQFFSSISASSTELKHCKKLTFVCNETRVKTGLKHTCFCPVVKNYGLSGGVIGWPIVKKGHLVGLTASERDSTDGTVLVAVLHPNFIRSIEEYIGKKVLEDQNTPPSVFRSNDLPEKYFIYDYSIARSRPQYQNPHSGATSIGLSAFILPVVALVS